MTTSTPPRRSPRRRAGGSGGGWAPALTPETAVRIAILGGIAMALLGVLLVRLWFLQVISEEEYTAKAEGNRLRTVITQPARGNILTRDMKPLVQNKLGENLVALPRDLTGENRTVVLTRLARKLSQLGEPVSAKELIKQVNAGDNRPLEPVILAENIDPELYRYLAERRRDYPGLQLQQSYLRSYPQGQLAAHVLGSTGRIGPSQIAAYRKAGYEGNETIGVSGVEQTYEKFLAGTPGETVVEVDAAGEPQGRGYVSAKSPVPGRDIVLSIDGPTQTALEGALAEATRVTGAQGAAGVALDPRTGEVLAMASYPTYAPNVFVTRNQKRIEKLNTDETRPLFDRAIAGQYPAGSTFKPITAAAALGDGALTTTTPLESASSIVLYKQRFSNFRGHSHGFITLPTALEVSSDTYFYQVADRLWQRQDEKKRVFPLQDEARTFGLGKKTGIDIPGEEAGLVPDPVWKQKRFKGKDYTDFQRSWLAGDTIQLGVGQGYLQVTPLQMAAVYGAIADGGTLRTPTVAREVRDPNGRVVQQLSKGKPTKQLGIDAAGLASIKEGLYQAANGPDGTSTGVFAQLPADKKVAGKTGTAEPGDGGEDHSWFVGYAPYDNPEIVVSIVIERGGTGANAAAPVACTTMGAYLKFDASLCGVPTVESR
jgi:penicillin-binding protein 2